VRKQSKNLCELCELDVEPSSICHPHEDSLFLVKEESGVELDDDFLIPIVGEQQQISGAMEFTSFQDPVEVHITLVPHMIKVNPLMLHQWRRLPVEHIVAPILVKEGPEPLIRAPLLV
jgi:hypothetical protein